MRPTYEREYNRQAEAAVAEQLAKEWNCQVFGFPKFSCCDWIFHTPKPFIAELKCRTNSIMQYDTYMISASKLIKAKIVADLLKVGARLIVRWTDAIGYVELVGMDAPVTRGGRTDRGDPNDVEWCYHIDTDHFTIVSIGDVS